MDNDLISIVTVVKNDANRLRETIESIAKQTYKPMELIIIDGKSTDGTLDIIREHENMITAWKSEPDSGIYDAMNKGVLPATGKWILFMNAGDTFASDNVLSALITACEPNTDILYGDTEMLYGEIGVLRKARPLSLLKYGPIAVPQSMLIRRELLMDYPLQSKLYLGADHDFQYEQYLRGKTFQHVPITVACFAYGGYSNQYIATSCWHSLRASWSKKPDIHVPLVLGYKVLLVWFILYPLRFMLPKHIFGRLQCVRQRIQNRNINSPFASL